MIRINLLAERKQKKQHKKMEPLIIQEKKRVPAFLVTFFVIIFATALVMGLAYFLLKMNVDDLQEEYRNNNAQLADLRKKVEEVKKLEVLNKAIQQKTDLIASLKKNQSVPARLLDDISKLLPGEAWLITVSYNSPQAMIEGVAFTNEDIVTFIDNLKKTADYTDVNLDESKQGSIDNVEVYQFKLNFKVRI
jgi:type IV pilus assembly protein PilN